MNRPAVNINFHHVLDLLDCVADEAATLLRERFTLSPAVVNQVDRLRQITGDRNHMVALGSAPGAMLQSFLADAALAHPKSYVDINGTLQPAFTTRDGELLLRFPAWLAAQSTVPEVVPGIDVADIPDRVDVALFGDWGTGTPGAARVSASISASPCTVRVHLGDVYYSGTAAETASYLVERWPRSGESVNRACNSNHEMYSGGRSYRRLTLPALRQQSSVFVLRNAHWLVVGLDTGSVDGRLSRASVQQLTAMVEGAGARHIVLMSHHPWFSWNDGPNRGLREDIGPLLRTGRVRAWYSAHDHGFVRFDRDPEFGVHLVCTGHGGFPYTNVPTEGVTTQESGEFRLRSIPRIAENPPGEGLLGPSGQGHRAEEYGPPGWVQLTFDGPTIVERVMDLDGQPHFPYTVTAGQR